MGKSARPKKKPSFSASPPWAYPGRLKEPPPQPAKDRITILGCGTSTGTPIVGCPCATCTSTDPRNRRGRASVCIQASGRTFLIDTSPDLRQQALSTGLLWVDAILYTHPHSDHLHGINDIRTFNFIMGRRIDAYGNDWTLKEIQQSFRYIFAKTQEGGGKPAMALHLIERPRTIAGVKVTPIHLVHGGLPVLGYRINDIAYITDCSYVRRDSFRSLKNLEILVLDCLRPGKHPTHLNVDEALALAAQIGAKRTYFTHMGHEIEYESFARTLPANMFPAYDGLVIECP